MHYHTIIIGAGSMGMPTSYFSAKNGHKTLLIDTYEPPHTFGTHHGDTRIIRYAYGEGAQYVPLALRAATLFKEAEQLTNRKLLEEVGVLNIGKEDTDFMQNVFKSAERFQLPIEKLSTSDIEKRWPGINLVHNEIGAYEPNAGFLHVEECIRAYKDLASQEGAVFAFNEKVVSITQGDGHVEVKTHKSCYTTDYLIVTAGAFVKELMSSIHLPLPVTILRKTFAWYDSDERFSEQNFPCFSFELENATYYGFPSVNGMGLKIGRHDGGVIINPNNDRDDFSLSDQEELDEFLHEYMPSIQNLKFGKTCMYDMTPDEDFIIDYFPGNERIVLASGFSGHGFKFASAIGELLVDMTNKKDVNFDLSLFSLERFKNS